MSIHIICIITESFGGMLQQSVYKYGVDRKQVFKEAVYERFCPMSRSMVSRMSVDFFIGQGELRIGILTNKNKDICYA